MFQLSRLWLSTLFADKPSSDLASIIPFCVHKLALNLQDGRRGTSNVALVAHHKVFSLLIALHTIVKHQPSVDKLTRLWLDGR
jgi:hypothetical protein